MKIDSLVRIIGTLCSIITRVIQYIKTQIIKLVYIYSQLSGVERSFYRIISKIHVRMVDNT